MTVQVNSILGFRTTARSVENRKVFISYARKDEEFVLPVAEILRAGGAKVFIDSQNIDYGEVWESVLLENLRSSDRILVFWSANASKSDWVRREYLSAVKEGLRVIPVPLDRTPLPPELAVFQALTALVPLVYAAHKQGIFLFPQISWQIIPWQRIAGLGTTLAFILLMLSMALSSSSTNFILTGRTFPKPSLPPLSPQGEAEIFLIMMSTIAIIFLILLSSLIWTLSHNKSWRETFSTKLHRPTSRPTPVLQEAIYKTVFYT